MSDIIYTDSGSVGAQYRLRFNGANLELLRDGVVIDSQPLASVDSVTINGGIGNDTLLIDELISLSGGVTFNGGAQSGPPGDAIIVQPGALSSAEVTYTNATDGRMVFTTGATTAVYNFTGIDPVDMTGSTVIAAIFNLPGGTNTQLEDNGVSGDNTSQIRDANVSPGFDTTTFAHPTGSLTINGTATDNVNVNLVDNLGVIALTINANTTTFTSLGATTLLASVTTDATGTTAINNGAITTIGAQTYNDVVTLGANTVLVSTGSGNLSFAGTVDGAFSLAASTAGTTTFGGVVGGTTALTSVTTSAGGTTAINGGFVTTTGAQTYSDTVILGANTLLTSTSGGNVQFGSTLDGAFSLIVNAGGGSNFFGIVGGTTALTSVTTDNGGVTRLFANVTTTGAQSYNDQIALFGNVALTSTGSGNISFAQVDNTLDLTVNTAGTTTFGGAVGGGTALTSVTTNAAGTTALNGGSVTTTGAQSYNDAVTLGANTVLASTGSGNLSFAGTVNGAFSLNVGTAGTKTFGGAVGGTTALTSVLTGGGGTTALNGGFVTTTGAQAYFDAVTLGAFALLTSTDNGNLTFFNTVNGAFSLDARTGGTTTFGGAVGGTTALTSVFTDVLGTTQMNGGSVTTTGAQNYDDSVILGADTVLTSTGSGDLTLRFVGGAFNLAANTAGTTTFHATVGFLNALASLTTDAAGTTAINGGSVTTTGAQTYNDAVTLGANTVLASTGSGNLSFASTVNGTFSLAANTAGTTTFGGAVGGSTALASLTTDAAGTTAINGGAVTTSGAQSYNDAVTLGATTALTGAGITFASTLNNNGFGLTVTESGTGQFGDVISGSGAFTKAGTGTTTFAAANLYTGATTINAGTLLVNGSIASPITAVNATGTLGGSGTTGAVTVAPGGTLSPGASAGILHTGSVTFAAGANFSAELGGTIAGADYDRLSATGHVDLAGATLTGSLLGSPVVGNPYSIITAIGGVSGTFAGLADGATTYIGNRAFQIDYSATNVDLTLGALKISGTDPVNILADVNTTTIDGSNAISSTQSVATTQAFNADVTGAVNAGVTVNGRGLTVASTKAGGTVDFVNSGAITVDDPSALSNTGLTLEDSGGGVHYSGSGNITAAFGSGLIIANASASGGVNLVEVGGTISSSGGFGVGTFGDTTTVVVSGTVTGAAAIFFDPTSSNNVVDLKPTAVINGNLAGSGNDDGVRLSGVSGSGSFDLNKIASGFSTLTKVEGSTWTVTGTFADPDAATIIVNGTLLVNGTIGGGVTVATSFTETLLVPLPVLGGTGTVGNVLVQDKGTLAPGTSAGTLTVTGNLTMLGGSTLSIEIGGAGAGQFDVLNVNGTAPDTGAVELGGATLTGSLIGGFTASVGQVFEIIDNAGADAIASPFNGIGEGGTVNFGGQTFAVSYVGGDGNDVTLTAIAAFGTPALSGFGPSANVTQTGPAATPQVLDSDVVFTDAEGNFNGGTLTVSGLLAEDIVSVPSLGTDPGQFLIDENGAVDRLFFEGVEIGGISGGAGTALNITFNGAATTNAIDALIENLTFLDLSANPTFERTLSLNVTDAAATSTGAQPLLVRVFNGDIQFGTPGNDSFAPAGNAHIDAGGGIDTITFDFRLVDATVTYSGNQVTIDAPSRHMVLSGFEVFNFTDGTVNNNDGDVLVDDLFYYSKYHDVWTAHVDADAHYHNTGWHEGRDPDAFFSTVIYLSANPDVKAAGVDPLKHFDQSGWKEGRVPSINFDPAAYLAANPDVAAAHVDPLAHFLQLGAGEGRQPFAPSALIGATGFDYVFYLQHNPDVAAAGVDPLAHFQQFGWKEGRNPNALFDTNGYLANYADVAAAHINPLDHYNQFGWHEGRDPSVNFDTTSYLAAYPDVNAAHVNPLTHFLAYGIHEGRSGFADGVWG